MVSEAVERRTSAAEAALPEESYGTAEAVPLSQALRFRVSTSLGR